MALLAARSAPAISYNPDFLSEQDVDRLLALRLPDELPAVEALRLLDVFQLPAFVSGDAKALYDDGATRSALDQALSVLLEDPDYKREIEKGGKDALVKKSMANLTTQLTTASVNEKVAKNNQAARDSVRIVKEDGKIALKVDETILLAADPNLLRGVSLALILQIAAVFLDVFALLCTAIGIAIEHGSGGSSGSPNTSRASARPWSTGQVACSGKPVPGCPN